MTKDNFTPTPNILFDNYLKNLTLSELKILLIIIRQTNGWINQRTGERKRRDRITHSQFMIKTNLSRRIVSETIKSLSEKDLIEISDFEGNKLNNSNQRKGKPYLFYNSNLEQIQSLQNILSTCANSCTNLCKNQHQPVQNMVHNKRNYNKIKYTKEREDSLKQIKDVISEKWNIRKS